jgi:starch-binding outer membrane protein, SusD/RagB family
MKNIKSLLAVALVGATLSACNDLQQQPLSSVVTADQKKQVIEGNPEMMSASVNAIPNMTSSRFAIWGGNPRQDADFGVPSIFLIMDHRGQDMPSAVNGYQWYTAALEMSDFGGSYYDNFIIWNTFYNLINTCNSVCALVDPDTEDGIMQYFRAQAVGYRAYAYLNLGQLYQFTYAKDPQAPTVPVITDLNLDEAAANGMPRATCEALYAQVMSDLNEAISLLDKAEAAGYTRATQASGNLVKTFMNQTVVYGLRARTNLLLQDYAAAEADAKKAIDLAGAEGLSPYAREEVQVPGINKISDHSWVWGFYVDPQSLLTGLIGWGGQMTPWHASLCYPGAGCYRCINNSQVLRF